MKNTVAVVGGGLAGCEAAWQAARQGLQVQLYEMRPERMTPAHAGGDLAELVCSNSLGSNLTSSALGLLKEELRRLGSLLISVADEHRLPAGSALAVDRDGFARAITRRLEQDPAVSIVRKEVTRIPAEGPLVLATGPLTSDSLAKAIQALTGRDNLYFYDAIAPIVEAETVDMGIAFRASRYDGDGPGTGDYINCPMSRQEYAAFHQALVKAERIPLREFEATDPSFFEACLPVEVLAARGVRSLAFGPLRPVGLRDPRTGHRPYAIVQLRQDNAAGTLYNLVGFQTNLRYGEQKRVFRMIPGLENAEFVRYGSMHRNTYIAGPVVLRPTLQYRSRDDLYFAGQLAGLEGYAGNVAGGWLAGTNAARAALGQPQLTLPSETMFGALIQYVTGAAPDGFQPMKANFGLVPPLPHKVKGKRARREAHAARALDALSRWMMSAPWPAIT